MNKSEVISNVWMWAQNNLTELRGDGLLEDIENFAEDGMTEKEIKQELIFLEKSLL